MINRFFRTAKIAAVCLLSLLTLLMPLCIAGAADDTAENLSARCKYSADFTVHAERLRDADFDTVQKIAKGKTVSVAWDDSVPVASVYVSFYAAPVAHTIMQFDEKGSKLSEEAGSMLYNDKIPVLPETRKVSFRADADNCQLCSLYALGTGSYPDYHPFAETIEKADYMTFAMHPDDDVLFLGAIYPIYEADRGLSGISMIMSTKLPEKFQRERRQEDMNGAWILGLKTQPVFGGFPDIPQNYYNQFHHTFTKDDVTRYAVTMIRTYRPEVVMTQDLNGEYGHWQHKVLAQGIQAAVPLAADPDYQPKGYPKTDPWEVKKLYIHLYDQNKLTLDVDRPIAVLNGKSAFETAQDAFLMHPTQTKKDNHHVSKTEYSLAEFGLAYTTVGLDTPGINDMFEHIDPLSLSVTPAPVITPSPTPEITEAPVTPEPVTAEPTFTPEPVVPDDTPQPEITAVPVIAEDTAIPSVTPELTPVDPATTMNNRTNDIVFWIGGGLLVLLVVLLILLIFTRKRR
jgi:LmbE family N-acetylglucosaminyl deacetylase